MYYNVNNSHYYIVISLEQLEDTEAIKESQLLSANKAKRDTDLPLYVTASVSYNDFQRTFTIGDSSSSTDPLSQRIFYNVPLQKEHIYYYFIRAYSTAHSTQVCNMHNMILHYFLTVYSIHSLVPVTCHLQLVSIPVHVCV